MFKGFKKLAAIIESEFEVGPLRAEICAVSWSRDILAAQTKATRRRGGLEPPHHHDPRRAR